MFNSNSSLNPLVGEGCVMMCELVVNEDLLAAYFDNKQFRDLIIQHPSPSLTTFAFRSREARPRYIDIQGR